ncbi:hypothetical protein [Mycoplasma sp. SG1]|uniref:hypothetical protein n=1 Tax=Mycoplasma sp. SG1 TaxID=2810348 RepID=UPI0020253DCA|nr:hypothetical protein [Mycoplasma sp. SG1]URM53163.1 hypothetical protein JRW51_02330 [Mycoplasma sp. SG1]
MLKSSFYSKSIRNAVRNTINELPVLSSDKKNIWKITKLINRDYLFNYHKTLNSIYQISFKKDYSESLIKQLSKYIVFESLQFNLFFKFKRFKRKYKSINTCQTNSFKNTSLKSIYDDFFNLPNNTLRFKPKNITEIINQLLIDLNADQKVLESYKLFITNGACFFLNEIFKEINLEKKKEWEELIVLFFLLILIHNNYYYFFVNNNRETGIISEKNEYNVCQLILKILKNLHFNCKEIFKIEFNKIIQVINKNLRLI